jgi:hypothetical protein
MAASRVATDSAAELKKIVGDDSTATFESDPKFIDSDSTDNASSENIEVQRDTDDTEDSDEEEDEAEDEDESGGEDDDLEDDEEDDEDEDDDEELEDDDDEVGVLSAKVVPIGVPDSSDEDGNATERGSDEDLDDEHEGAEEAGFEGDSRQTDREIDAALRMSAMMTVAAGFAANI